MLETENEFFRRASMWCAKESSVFLMKKSPHPAVAGLPNKDSGYAIGGSNPGHPD